MNKQLSSRLEGIREILMAHYKAGAKMPAATKGSERETLVREFLSTVFPAPFRFGTGAVIDSSGALSGQLDIVVEFPFLISFPTPGSADRLYLAESVAFVLEVKSDLIKQWDQIESSVSKFSLLRRQWAGHLAFESGGALEIANPTISRIPYVAVGFMGSENVDSLKAKIESTQESSRPDAVLVLNSGVYVGPTRSAVGSEGFLALCADMSYFARNVLTAVPHLDNYFDN